MRQSTAIEENYLKAIYKIENTSRALVSTSELALAMEVQAASVTDMLKKLASKKLIHYKKYHGVKLTATGKRAAMRIVRKHRLWETLLVKKLGFSWSDVHAVAEQLEHVDSEELIDRLDSFLGYPETDPHGDPIPGKDGEIIVQESIPLTQLKESESGKIAGVQSDQKELLDYLEKLDLLIGNELQVMEIHPFDGSMKIKISGKNENTISQAVSSNLLIKKAD